ncbi:MAG: transposase [Acetobacteraceae bacterium]|nr:transposase [Acetobacteraceae bacterium]
MLLAAGIKVSMDGRERWMDNVFIERLWQSLKDEDVYLKSYANGAEAHAGMSQWIGFYKLASSNPPGYVVEENRFC